MTAAFENDIEKCIAVLAAGGTIVYPTDTIWGIGCDATNAAAVEKVFRMKNRPEEKSMIILLAEERDVIRYVAQPDLQVFEFLEQVDKPTTIIYDGPIGLADNCISPDGTVAIRVTRDPFCKALIKRFRKPIISTSANLAGEPHPANFTAISPSILQAAEYVVHHRRADLSTSSPSAIVRWHANGTHTVIRP